MDLDEVRATLEARRDDTQARVATLAKRPEKRLRAMPDLVLCIECAKRGE